MGLTATAVPTTRRELRIGWTETASRAPHPALCPLVSRYWGYVERYDAPMRRRAGGRPRPRVARARRAHLRRTDVVGALRPLGRCSARAPCSLRVTVSRRRVVMAPPPRDGRPDPDRRPDGRARLQPQAPRGA